MKRPLWPPTEAQSEILGAAPPCPVCGAATYWDEVWDDIFIACCVQDVLHLGAYAYVREGLKVHKKRRKRT